MKDPEKKLYSIGEVAALAGIPVTTLRYYDKEEMLVPAVRDDKSGYRYYDVSQLEKLMMLRELKHLGLPLKDIKEFLDSKDYTRLEDSIVDSIVETKQEIKNLLGKVHSMEILYQRLKQYRKNTLLADFDDHKTEKNTEKNTNRSIEVKMQEVIWVLSTRYKSFLDVDESFLDRIFELQHIRNGYGLFSAGPYIAVFHDGYERQFNKEEGDLEVCVPIIKPDNFKCPELRNYGGGLVAGTIHEGSYHDVEESYQFLVDWISNNNYEIIGPASEFYYMDVSSSVVEDDFITKIFFPVKPLTGV